MTGRAKGQRVAGSRVPLRHVEAPAAVAALARATAPPNGHSEMVTGRQADGQVTPHG
jgi:hypothetical protein